MSIDPWLHANLVCPYDGDPLTPGKKTLECPRAHVHRIVDGIPILLRRDVAQTHWAGLRALDLSEEILVNGAGEAGAGVHPFVQTAIGGTNGFMYQALSGKLSDYPIPVLRAQPSSGSRLLDIGCNWGRWSVAASRAGFDPVGIDPSFEAIHAARAVTRQLGINARFVVADARHLPFRSECFDFAFSYSVLQHLSKSHVRESLAAIRRVLRAGGTAMIQMPNKLGIRSIYHQARRAFREAKAFEVRYWSFGELRETFSELVGPTEIGVDGFLSLNVQASDRVLLPARFRVIVSVSEGLRRLSETFPSLRHVADSLYVSSKKPASE